PETVLQRVKPTDVNPKLSKDEIATQLVRDRLRLLFPSRKHKLIRKSLGGFLAYMMSENGFLERGERHLAQVVNPVLFGKNNIKLRSEERRVGKECRTRWRA